ncbi:P-loop containing nucleoside triphosphate hydrolase protein [Aspergillus carlsbadensis]|nr:P-loop containing nucleoside triphosphate hydrolase protein [Aspergillus carlsbadensis]
MTTQAIENVASRQLQSEQAELLNTIDRLADLGVRQKTELPQVVVWGRQWREKALIPGYLSGIPFPTKGDGPASFTTEVSLRRHPHSGFKAVIVPSLSRTAEVRNRLRAFTLQLFTSERDLWCVYEEVAKYLHSTGTVTMDDILRVEICGPDKPNVTIVDLPALHLSTTSDGDTKKDLSVARQTVERYMGNPNSILLAVMNASNLPKTLKTAEKFDPNLERTIGVIVHPDVLEPSSDDEDKCLQLLGDGRAKLPLGWHALSTATQEDPVGNPSGQVSGKLHIGKWAELPQEIVGFGSLRRRVSQLLLERAQRNLPQLIAATEGTLKEKQAKLAKLGICLTGVEQQRGELLRIACEFESIVRQALWGTYNSGFFGEPGTSLDPNFNRLRTIMTMLHSDFVEAMLIGGASRQILYDNAKLTPRGQDNPTNRYLQDWVPNPVTQVELEREINDKARFSQEVGIVGFGDHFVVRSLFQTQVQPWPSLARKHLRTASEAATEFLGLLLQHISPDHIGRAIHQEIISPALERIEHELTEKLAELSSHHTRAYPSISSKTLLDSSQRLYKHQPKDSEICDTRLIPCGQSEEPPRDRYALKIIDSVQAYYDSAMVVFTENIATLAIENRLLLPLETILCSKLVCGMGQEQVERLVSEPASFDSDRQALRLEIDTLEACLGICRRYIKPVNFLKHQRSKGKPTFSSPSSVLSVSPDINRSGLSTAPQKRRMEETPTGVMRPQQRARLGDKGNLPVSPMPMPGGNNASQTNQSGFESHSGTPKKSPFRSFLRLVGAASPTSKDGQKASPPSTVGFDFNWKPPN